MNIYIIKKQLKYAHVFNQTSLSLGASDKIAFPTPN